MQLNRKWCKHVKMTNRSMANETDEQKTQPFHHFHIASWPAFPPTRFAGGLALASEFSQAKKAFMPLMFAKAWHPWTQWFWLRLCCRAGLKWASKTVHEARMMTSVHEAESSSSCRNVLDAIICHLYNIHFKIQWKEPFTQHFWKFHTTTDAHKHLSGDSGVGWWCCRWSTFDFSIHGPWWDSQDMRAEGKKRHATGLVGRAM